MEMRSAGGGDISPSPSLPFPPPVQSPLPRCQNVRPVCFFFSFCFKYSGTFCAFLTVRLELQNRGFVTTLIIIVAIFQQLHCYNNNITSAGIPLQLFIAVHFSRSGGDRSSYLTRDKFPVFPA